MVDSKSFVFRIFDRAETFASLYKTVFKIRFKKKITKGDGQIGRGGVYRREVQTSS